jgi:hypothetical protein
VLARESENLAQCGKVSPSASIRLGRSVDLSRKPLPTFGECESEGGDAPKALPPSCVFSIG